MVLLSLSGAVLITEIGLRTYSALWPSERSPKDRSGSLVSNPPFLNLLLHPDPRFVPGISGPARYQTNSWGIRGAEVTSSDQYRILFVGGSTTECLYLDQDEQFPAITALLLTDGLNAAVWAGNIGKGGFNSNDHILQLKTSPLPIVDLVVVMMGLNDVQYFLATSENFDPHAQYVGSKPLLLTNLDHAPEPLELGRSSLVHFIRRAVILANPMIQSHDGKQYSGLRAKRKAAVKLDRLPEMAGAIENYILNVQELSNLIRGRRAQPVFVTHPALWYGDLTDATIEDSLWFGGKGNFFEREVEYYTARALKKALAQFNVALMRHCAIVGDTCIDVATRLAPTRSNFYDDAHLTERGAARLAEILAAELAPILSGKSGKRDNAGPERSQNNARLTGL